MQMLMKVVTEERQDGTKLFFVAGDLNVEIGFFIHERPVILV